MCWVMWSARIYLNQGDGSHTWRTGIYKVPGQDGVVDISLIAIMFWGYVNF
jgi:hypothetical protein